MAEIDKQKKKTGNRKKMKFIKSFSKVLLPK